VVENFAFTTRITIIFDLEACSSLCNCFEATSSFCCQSHSASGTRAAFATMRYNKLKFYFHTFDDVAREKNGHNEFFISRTMMAVMHNDDGLMVSLALRRTGVRSGQHLTVGLSSCVAAVHALWSLSWPSSPAEYEFDNSVHGRPKRKSLQIRDRSVV